MRGDHRQATQCYCLHTIEPLIQLSKLTKVVSTFSQCIQSILRLQAFLWHLLCRFSHLLFSHLLFSNLLPKVLG
jgi:hypothetical protein